MDADSDAIIERVDRPPTTSSRVSFRATLDSIKARRLIRVSNKRSRLRSSSRTKFADQSNPGPFPFRYRFPIRISVRILFRHATAPPARNRLEEIGHGRNDILPQPHGRSATTFVHEGRANNDYLPVALGGWRAGNGHVPYNPETLFGRDRRNHYYHSCLYPKTHRRPVCQDGGGGDDNNYPTTRNDKRMGVVLVGIHTPPPPVVWD